MKETLINLKEELKEINWGKFIGWTIVWYAIVVLGQMYTGSGVRFDGGTIIFAIAVALLVILWANKDDLT